jgi:hypothetical protein
VARQIRERKDDDAEEDDLQTFRQRVALAQRPGLITYAE